MTEENKQKTLDFMNGLLKRIECTNDYVVITAMMWGYICSCDDFNLLTKDERVEVMEIFNRTKEVSKRLVGEY